MIIRKTIQCTLVMWRLEQPLKFPTLCAAGRRCGLRPIITPPLADAATQLTVTAENWTDPIRQTLDSGSFCVYIYAVQVHRESTQREVSYVVTYLA